LSFAGHGSGLSADFGALNAGSDEGELSVIRAFDANVSGSENMSVFWGDFAANEDALASGLACEVLLENGFPPKGLPPPPFIVDVPPNNWLPRLTDCVEHAVVSF
jgi:hypothetical protein